MLRFLLAGTATVGGLMLLFVGSFADPGTIRAWRSALPALPLFQPGPEPAAPQPAAERQPGDAVYTAFQQQRAALQDQLRGLEAQISGARQEISTLQAQAAQAKLDLDDARLRRIEQEAALQAAEAAKAQGEEAAKPQEAKGAAPGATPEAAPGATPVERQAQAAIGGNGVEQAGAAPAPSGLVPAPQPGITSVAVSRTRPPHRPGARADARQHHVAQHAVSRPVQDRPPEAAERALAGGEPAATEAIATQAVLDRLRQQAASGPAPEPAVTPGVSAEPARQAALSDPRWVPPRDRLARARGAIAAGRIAEAQRLLEEAQLQLVFRPPSPTGGTGSGGSRSAGQVADALTMLGSGDPGRAVQFIDQALAESGAPAEAAPPNAGISSGAPYR